MKKIICVLLSVAMIFTMAFSVSAAGETTETPFENSNFYTVGDYTLHYRIYDNENAQKQIMLIHGFCLSSISLEGVAELYQNAGYRVVLVDCPNFGYSSRENTETVFMDREEVIFSLMEYLGGKWIVGGHSMGGGIAINLACDYEENVSGLVLFAPQTSAEGTATSALTVTSMLMQKIFTVILKFAARIPFLVRALVAMSFSDSEYARTYDLSKITDSLLIDGTGAGIAIMTTHAKGPDFEKFSTLTIPCVIITSKEDKVAAADNLSEIIENAPSGTVTYEFEKGGHNMMEYNPQLAFQKTVETIEKCN